MKKLILFLGICVYAASLFPQNITNTLGSNGLFIIKDVSNNYLTLDQSTGLVNILGTLRLENTTFPDLGVIFKGADRFIHNFGLNNTFLGINSGNFTMTGGYNIALGDQSFLSNTIGNYNTAMGVYSLYSNTTGERNTAVGSASLYSNTTGNYNIAIGNGSLSTNTNGYKNTALGNQSLAANTEGYENTALGYQSLYSNTFGTSNTATGKNSLYSNTLGEGNTASGINSLQRNSEGYFNTAFGSYAGSEITTGYNLTCVGLNSQPTTASASDQITLGNGSITSLRCNVTTITSLSDARDKKNIKELNLGINFLMKIKPRLFNWDKREWYDNNKSDGSKMKEVPTAGFIAQELDEVQTTENSEWLNLVLKDNPEKWEATPGNLLPIMVKAIQDLKKENDELKVKNEYFQTVNGELKNKIENVQVANEELKSNIVELTGRITKFEQMQNMLVSEIEKLKTKNNETEK